MVKKISDLNEIPVAKSRRAECATGCSRSRITGLREHLTRAVRDGLHRVGHFRLG